MCVYVCACMYVRVCVYMCVFLLKSPSSSPIPRWPYASFSSNTHSTNESRNPNLWGASPSILHWSRSL